MKQPLRAHLSCNLPAFLLRSLVFTGGKKRRNSVSLLSSQLEWLLSQITNCPMNASSRETTNGVTNSVTNGVTNSVTTVVYERDSLFS
jgi:hypothetical protein